MGETNFRISRDGQNLTKLRFADDVVLVDKNVNELQKMSGPHFKLSQEVGRRTNLQKTKYMSGKENMNLRIEGQVFVEKT